MFDIGWSEFLVIIVVILIVVGPKDLPRIIRTFGQWTGKARSYARDFQRTIEEAAEETEMSAIRKEIELANKEIAEAQKSTVHIDTKIRLDDDAAAPTARGGNGAKAPGTASGGDAPAPSQPASQPDPAASSIAQAVQAGETAASTAQTAAGGGAEAEVNPAKSG